MIWRSLWLWVKTVVPYSSPKWIAHLPYYLRGPGLLGKMLWKPRAAAEGSDRSGRGWLRGRGIWCAGEVLGRWMNHGWVGEICSGNGPRAVLGISMNDDIINQCESLSSMVNHQEKEFSQQGCELKRRPSKMEKWQRNGTWRAYMCFWWDVIIN